MAAYAKEITDSKRRPYKMLARAEAQQQTRDALLDAADEELTAGGWSKTSLEKLAAKAGVTKQTALRHFGSKEGLVEAAIRRTSEIVRKERARAPVGDVPGAVRNLLEHYERWGSLVMRVLAEEHRLSLVRKATDRGRQVHYDWVDYVFAPQLRDLDEQARLRRRAALIGICDVQMWWLLSHDLGLERAEVQGTMIEAIEGVIGEQQT